MRSGMTQSQIVEIRRCIYIDIYVCIRDFQIQEILKGTHQCSDNCN